MIHNLVLYLLSVQVKENNSANVSQFSGAHYALKNYWQ
jgi:hypothetical protein